MAYVSPGVDFQIRDLSEYVRNVPGTIGFIPIISEKGKDNELVFTNARDFYIDFGVPNISYGGKNFGQGKYVADSFLANSDALYVIRCTATDAQFANIIFYGEESDAYGADGTSTVSVKYLPNDDDITTLNTENEIRSIVDFDGVGTDSTNAALAICGVGRGAWYNNFKISITPHANVVRASEGIYVCDIWQKQDTLDYDNNTQSWVEAFEIVRSFEVSFDPDMLDGSADSMFIADVINRFFTDIVVYADRDMCKEMTASGTDWSIPFIDGPIRLGGGSDGSTLADATQLLSNAYQGILPRIRNLAADGDYRSAQVVDEVLDTEDYYFNLIFDAGYPGDVKTQAVELTRLRGDCMAIVDIGENRSVAEALNARRNVYTYNDYRTAVYDGYSKVYDIHTGRDIWVSPVYHMANIIPYTDNVSEIWYAPAGFNRATLSKIKSLYYSPRRAERDQFYLEQINPIVKFNVGYTVWGQLTSQKRPTALQDVNISRLILYIKRALEQYCKFYIFEMNDEETWNSIRANVDMFLAMIKERRGLYSYGVEVGATEYEIKSKQIHVNVTLRPTRVVEKINLVFSII